jgi:AAA15 family ATPase/GTPase
MLTLTKFKVTNFRSVMDSGWIDCDDVTTLIGINEAGKSNLLLALWKLNPARKEGEATIDPQHDMPNSKFSTWRNELNKHCFIRASFELDDESTSVLSENGIEIKDVVAIEICRYFNGGYIIYRVLNTGVRQRVESDLHKVVLGELPSFVYYSNYNNLDAQIYLPHAVDRLEGKAVPGYENPAKERTLRIMFEFVGLEPREILELGQAPVIATQTQQYHNRNLQQPSLTQDAIDDAASEKAKRATLLNSASARLTKEFKAWWKQGEYKFRLQADGDFFKIWVSDDKRDDEIELERRSTGLQWFLSFFLVFLVESESAHKGAILLLDEAGLTLHPMAQKDLMNFFKGLSESNQIIHTTHSPFLVDTDNIDRVKVVYIDTDGLTVASSDLLESSDKQNLKSIYPAHAAIGLNVSEILLNGCQPIIVEGTSDQHYLNAIKCYLIEKGKLKPRRDMLFMPAGGCKNKGISALISIVSAKNDDVPFSVLDSDIIGKSAKTDLLKGVYKDFPKRIVSIADIVLFDNSEVEDLMPFELLQPQLNKWFGNVDDDFEPKSNIPILGQIVEFAENNSVNLPDGWKVMLSLGAKRQLQKPRITVSDDCLKKWTALFKTLNGK